MSNGEKTIGIVGLGNMGGAFAKNLVAAGFHVVGFDIDPAARRAARKAGAELAADAVAVARVAPVIITSLPNPAALHATVAQLMAAKLPKRTIVEASTFTLADKLAAEQALTDAGHLALDCPVSGTGAQARVKDLVIYASGDPRAIAKLKPVFLGIGRAVHDLGAYGNGSRMKYVANLLVAIHNVASAEAMVLGIKSGLDPKQIFELVKAGAGNSRIFELRAPMMVADHYTDASMTIKVWQKDLAVIGEHAAQLGCPTPLMSATLPIYAAAMSMGHAAHDTAAVCAVLEDMAGVKRKPGGRQRKSKVAVSARTAAGSR
ncbi:MAG: NAD(P)-dependent oxidoreductase [Xanthobacteraceae bacterium]|nr:NAD(P)-dependent oxidoreductase [Xanthobacteraceae bacterium]